MANPAIAYIWQEPNAPAQKLIYMSAMTGSYRTPESLKGLTADLLNSKLSQFRGDYGKQTFGDWLSQNKQDLGPNPYSNAKLMEAWANAQGAASGVRQTVDEYGRPLILGETGTIAYHGNPEDPSSWNPTVSWSKNGLDDARVAFDNKSGEWHVEGTYGGDKQKISLNAATGGYSNLVKSGAIKSTWSKGAPAPKTDTSLPGGIGGTPPEAPAGTPPTGAAPVSAARTMSGLDVGNAPRARERLQGVTGASTLNSSLAGQKGLEHGQDLADYMRSMQVAYQPNQNPNYQFTMNPRRATDLMPFVGNLPNEQRPGPGQQTPGLQDLIAARGAGQVGPGPVPIVNTPNPQFAQSAMSAAGIQNNPGLREIVAGGSPQGGSELALPGAPSPLGTQTGGK